MPEFAFKPPTASQVHEYFEAEKVKIFESVKEAYILACIDAVNRARSTDTYKDRTNNLHSSIGYVLYFNGQLVAEDFAVSGTGTGGGGDVKFTTKGGAEVSFTSKSKEASGQEGVRTGQEFAQMIAGRHKTDGFVAVIVAGMNYALYVEAKGYDVLTGSTLDITADLQKYFDIVNTQHGTSFRTR